MTKKETGMKEYCGTHAGLIADQKHFQKFKDSMEGPEGTIERLHGNIKNTEDALELKLGALGTKIEEKMSMKLSITLMGVILIILATVFTLSYDTQGKILTKLSSVESAVAVIQHSHQEK